MTTPHSPGPPNTGPSGASPPQVGPLDGGSRGGGPLDGDRSSAASRGAGPPGRARQNWAGNITFRAAQIHQPSSVAEAQSLVAAADRARALGTRHSFSDLADSPGSLISLAALPPLLEVDSAAATAKVGAGMRYADLGRALDQRGWALPNLGSLPHISVAGACATGTHGSGVGNGNLATAVRALEMITSDGGIVTLGRDPARPSASGALATGPGGGQPGAAVPPSGGRSGGEGVTLGRDPARPSASGALATGPLATGPGGGQPGAASPGGDRFDGAVVALGALGIVVSVTLDLVPSYTLAQTVYEWLPLEVLDDHFPDIMAGAYSVSLFTDWRRPRFQVWAKRRVGEPGHAAGEPGHAAAGVQGHASAAAAWFTARPADGPRYPVPGFPPDSSTVQQGIPGPWFERLPHFRPDVTPSAGNELQTEYLIPGRDAVAALHALDRVRDRIHPVLQVCEVRAVAADHLWLSPSFQRDAVALHFTWTADTRSVMPVVALIEEQLAPFHPRPHWGKIFSIAPAAVRAEYERLADFRKLAGDLDPAGKFGNAFTARYLAGD